MVNSTAHAEEKENLDQRRISMMLRRERNTYEAVHMFRAIWFGSENPY